MGIRSQIVKGDFAQTDVSTTVTHLNKACHQKSQFGSLEGGEERSQKVFDLNIANSQFELSCFCVCLFCYSANLYSAVSNF